MGGDTETSYVSEYNVVEIVVPNSNTEPMLKPFSKSFPKSITNPALNFKKTSNEKGALGIPEVRPWTTEPPRPRRPDPPGQRQRFASPRFSGRIKHHTTTNRGSSI